MPESFPAGSPAVPAVQNQLRTIARLLSEVHPLEPEVQRMLGALVEELSEALNDATVPSTTLAHLTESMANLVEAVHHQKEHHLLGDFRDRLQKAVVDVESHYPNLAGFGRQVLDTLSNLGI